MKPQDFKSIQEAYLEVYQLDEGKVELKQRNKNAMQRKAGNLGREVVSSKKGPKRDAAMDRMGKLVTVIARDDENKRFKTLGQSPAHNEEVDIYDIILSHLLDEGYAETPEAAEAIMVNMSEEWRDSVVEAKVDAGLSDAEKKKVRTARQGYAGANLPGSVPLHTGNIDRRAAHRERDDLNKDAKDIRKGRLNAPQFQGTTGAERLAQVKKAKGIR